MLQKYLSEKLVGTVAIVLGIGGILISLFPVTIEISETNRTVYSILSMFFNHINVSFFGFDRFLSVEIPSSDNSFYRYGLLNPFFYSLLIVGGILYLLSKGKNVMLLRLVFPMIFLMKIIFGILILIGIFTFSYKDLEPAIYFFIALNFAVHVLFAVFIFSIMKFLEKDVTLKTNLYQYEDRQSEHLVETSKLARFGHLIADNFFIVLIFSGFVQNLRFNSPLLEKVEMLENTMGVYPTSVLIIAMFRTIYYFTFEAFFGLTIGKILSRSKVVDEEGKKPTATTIIGRTLLRLIPFEALTFFMPRGLHDRSSNTFVVRENSPIKN